jgi:hypothetical protein
MAREAWAATAVARPAVLDAALSNGSAVPRGLRKTVPEVIALYAEEA